MSSTLKDHHDYELAQKEWDSTLKEDTSLARCHYCKIPIIAAGAYRRPVEYEDHYHRFQYVPARLYGHPSCILADMEREPNIHMLKYTFLLHKMLRVDYGYCLPLVKAPPREILPSFAGPMSFQHYGELLAGQQISCEHVYSPFYIPTPDIFIPTITTTAICLGPTANSTS